MDPEMDDEGDFDDESMDQDDGYETELGHLIVAVLHDDSLDMKAKRKKILKALQLMDDPVEDDGPDDDDSTDMDDAEFGDDQEAADDQEDSEESSDRKDESSAECVRLFRTHQDPAVRRLAERFDRMKAKLRFRSRRDRARRLCERAKLPPAVVTDLFLEQLLQARDERTVRALVEDRRRLCGVRLPRSAARGAGGGMDVKEFAKQLRRGT